MKIHQSMNAVAVQMPVQHRNTLLQNNNTSLCARITSAFNRLIAWVQSLFKCGKTTPVITAQTTPTQTPTQNIIPPQPMPPVQIPVGQPVQVQRPAQPLQVNNPIALDMTRLGAERPYDDYEAPDAGVIDPVRHQQIKNQIVASIQNRMFGRRVERDGRFVLDFPENAIERNFNGEVRLNDHIQGALWGQALGDGLGLLTEFTTREQAMAMIRDRPLEFALKQDPAFLNGPQNEWRARFSDNAWTDDTDQAMALIEANYLHTLEQGNPRNSDRPFAERLRNWRDLGLQVHTFGQNAAGELIPRFPHLERDLGETVAEVVGRDEFVASPQRAAYMVWNNDRNRAANGALMRNSPIALMYHYNLQKAIDKSIRFALSTHASPLCVASCVAHTTAIFLALHNCRNFEQILEASREVGIAYLELFLRGTRQNLDAEQLAQIEGYKNEFNRYLNAQSWRDLALDGDDQGYTLKALGAAFYALKSTLVNEVQAAEHRLRLVLEDVIWQGGDADTNGAIAGSLLGAYYGQRALPQSWKDGLRERDREILEQALSKINHISQPPPRYNHLR